MVEVLPLLHTTVVGQSNDKRLISLLIRFPSPEGGHMWMFSNRRLYGGKGKGDSADHGLGFIVPLILPSAFLHQLSSYLAIYCDYAEAG